FCKRSAISAPKLGQISRIWRRRSADSARETPSPPNAARGLCVTKCHFLLLANFQATDCGKGTEHKRHKTRKRKDSSFLRVLCLLCSVPFPQSGRIGCGTAAVCFSRFLQERAYRLHEAWELRLVLQEQMIIALQCDEARIGNTVSELQPLPVRDA